VHVGSPERPLGSAVPAGLYGHWASSAGLDIAASISKGVREVRVGDRTETIAVRAVTPNAFALLGVPPHLGSGFSPAAANGAPPVILSYRVWQRLFDGRVDETGQVLWIDKDPYTVIGVMPARFWLEDMSSPVWIPMDMHRLTPTDALETIVRRAPGESVVALEARLQPALEDYASRQPEGARQIAIKISGVEGTPLGRSLSFIVPYLLATAAQLTLLIACANVAVIMFARWTARDREIAIRASIGASRGRLVRLLLTESTLLAATGGLLGIGATLALRALFLRNMDALAFYDLSIDPWVFAKVAGITFVAGVLAGIMPALYETRRLHVNPLRTLRESDRVRQRLRHGLVVFEVAVTVALLVVTSSMIAGYYRARNADLGFDARPLLGVSVEGPADAGGILDDLVRVTSEVPGVVAVAASTSVPFVAAGAREQVSSAASAAPVIAVERAAIRGPFFTALGVPIVGGRTFTSGETAETRTVVVNETLARRLFPNGAAVGATVWLSSVPHDVVGVVRDYASNPFRVAADEPRVFVPWQPAPAERQIRLVVRTAGDPAPIALALRREINRAVPAGVVSSAVTFDEVIRIGRREILAGTAPLVLLVSIGTVLTLAGIYGVLAFAVARRARELAVRVAIGASPRTLVWVVARRTSRLLGAGAGIGIALTYGLARMVRAGGGAGSLYDPPLAAFVIPVGAIVLVGLAATWLPARRAASIDPAALLRSE